MAAMHYDSSVENHSTGTNLVDYGGSEHCATEIDEKNDDTDHSTDPLAPLSASWEPNPLSEQQKAKVYRILTACRDYNLEDLSDLSASDGGFLEDEIRRAAWPILLGCNLDPLATQTNWRAFERHRDEGQVELDVNRSFVYYPENETEARLQTRKNELSDVITAVLRQHPILCYFQGYHDIVQVLLLVLGADAAIPVASRLSLLRIRDFMLPTLSGTQSHLRLLPAILDAADRGLYQHLSGATQPTPFFALAATLTLYAHDIEGYADIARLFDYILASEAVVPVYLFAVIIVSRKTELMEVDRDDADMLHFILSKLPKPLDLDGLIRKTAQLYKECPPERLPNRAWKQVSAYSVLKTARVPRRLVAQSLADGESLFAKHASEIRRQERLHRMQQRLQALARRYQRPARWAGAAIFVAAVALYLGRTDVPQGLPRWLSLAQILRQTAVQAIKKVLS